MTDPRPDWWSPEVLAERERQIRSGADAEADDIRNDFASYKALVGGSDETESGLHMHNEVQSWRIDTMCRDYAAVTRQACGTDPARIADLGCGAGFTTDGLWRTWPSARVTGFDVSVDAVQFARSRWPKCGFVTGAIVPGQPMDGAPFDLLLCQEFYPFTRTGSVATHREWLGGLLGNMSNDGLAIIMVAASTRDSINDTYTTLRREFALRRVQVAAPRIARRLPFALSRVAAVALRDAKTGWVRNLYVLQHQR